MQFVCLVGTFIIAVDWHSGKQNAILNAALLHCILKIPPPAQMGETFAQKSANTSMTRIGTLCYAM